MSVHKEIHLEDEICADLTAAGWLYDVADTVRYDRTHALFVDDAVAWIKASQPKAWEAIEKSHRRTVDAHIAPADGQVPSLEDALKILSEKVIGGR